MPLLELQPSMEGRFRVFARAQLPLAGSVLFIAVGIALTYPQAYQSGLLLWGLLLVGAATLAALLIPWERFASSWLITVAVVDIIAVAMIRTELLPVLPAVGLLSIFPVLWLAYGFHSGVIAVAIIGALFISDFPYLYRRVWPATPLEWLNVATLPAIVIGIAVIVNIASRRLRTNRAALIDSNTQQAAALQTAADSQILARGILDTVDAGVAFYAADKTLTLSNQFAANMSARARTLLDDAPYTEENIFYPDRTTPIPPEEQIVPRTLRGDTINREIEWLGPTGDQIAVTVSSRRVRRPDGLLLGIVIVAYDVTELVEAISVREEFLRTVSHELRTPLTSIVGYLELIEDTVDPETTTISTYLAVIQRNVDELLARITELLAAGDTAPALSPEPTDLTALVRASTDTMKDTAIHRHLTITLEEAEPAIVSIDPARIRQAIDQILSNAIKFTPDGGTITASVHTDTNGATVTITDTGIGMDPAEQRQAFDRFYRTPAARTQAIQGVGLGLATTKSIIQAHGGTITITSTPNQGTTLSLHLPHQPRDNQDTPDTSTAPRRQ